MVYDYLITLKKRDYRLADQVSQLMYLFALIMFAYFYYYHPKSGAVYIYIGIGILLSWLYTVIKKRKKGEAFFRLGLFIAAIGWVVGPERNMWMAILYAVAGLLEKQVKFPAEIGFSETEISFNSLPKKELQWNEIKNVIIKDGLITIDQHNNKLTQKEIEGYVTTDLEQEFNDFCRKCISASKQSE
jgi:Mn2+/Fe2+ NRAMP family transporter